MDINFGILKLRLIEYWSGDDRPIRLGWCKELAVHVSSDHKLPRDLCTLSRWNLFRFRSDIESHSCGSLRYQPSWRIWGVRKIPTALHAENINAWIVKITEKLPRNNKCNLQFLHCWLRFHCHEAHPHTELSRCKIESVPWPLTWDGQSLNRFAPQ